MTDNVNPPHYRRSSIETIDAIEAMIAGWPPETAYRLGNVLKYLWRHQDKGGVESLEKAAWYLQREINRQKASVGAEAMPARKKATAPAQRPKGKQRQKAGLLF